jgi:hypothetical protein
VVDKLDEKEGARAEKEEKERLRIKSEREEIEAAKAKGFGPSAPPADFDEDFEDFDDFDLPEAPTGMNGNPNPTASPTATLSVEGLPPPPLPPPSYEDLMARGLNGISVNGSYSTPNPSEAFALPPPPPAALYPSSVAPPAAYQPSAKIKKWSLPMRELAQQYAADWDSAKTSKKANVYMLETHQGKASTKGQDSTNGCTVIAPLIASAHITSLGGVSDITVEEIIDFQAPPLLATIRTKLGLSAGALIIPSDVHDHLFDNKIIEAESFMGVFGGNIMDVEHVGALVKCLLDNGTKKSAAALFFHAHVVCITKMATSSGEIWFDLIDSLPRREDPSKPASGCRIRCKDEETMMSCIKWYASQKFGPSDQEYIDKNEWDEDNCDFDPRVFQGFAWGDLAK